MNFEDEISQNGCVSTSNTLSKRYYTTGFKRTRKVNRDIDDKEIQTCLNCTEKKCLGYCDKIRKLNNGKKRN